MSIRYSLRESFWGFKRARLSAGLSIVTIWIALMLLGLYATLTVNTNRLVHSLRERIEMEAFLREPLEPEDMHRIRKSIEVSAGVDSIAFVSKQEAARVFQREFGEDVEKVLNFNPLPPSFKIYLREDYRTAGRAKEVHATVSAIAGIDTVVYRRELLDVLENRVATVDRVVLGLGAFVTLSAIMLVVNTIRLGIHARRRIIETMELVGATRMFVRRPFLIEGMIHGILGGTLASIMVYIIVERLTPSLSQELGGFVHMPIAFYGLVAGAGLILGLLGSLIAILRFLSRA
jgi:cell division transport system permease protein